MAIYRHGGSIALKFIAISKQGFQPQTNTARKKAYDSHDEFI
tara:strand:+ start:896 stop:1021 length:126 start_codon:yes stop_codon:yes gene_type:complete